MIKMIALEVIQGLLRRGGRAATRATLLTALALVLVPQLAAAEEYPAYDVSVINQAFRPLVAYNELQTNELIQGSGVVELPFPVRFFRDTYEYIAVSTAGYITFGKGTDVGMCRPDVNDRPDCARSSKRLPFPSDEYPNRLLAAWWDHLVVCQPGSVRYSIMGSEPNRTVTIQWGKGPAWNRACYKGSIIYQMQVIIREGTGMIDVSYGTPGRISQTDPNEVGNPANWLGSVGLMSPGSDGIVEGIPGLPCAPDCRGTEWPTNKIIRYMMVPDAAIRAVDVPSFGYEGLPTRIRSMIQNSGGGNLPRHQLRYVLLSSQEWDEDAIAFTTKPGPDGLGDGRSIVHTDEIILPRVETEGPWYVGVEVDRAGDWPGNNRAISNALYIGPPSPSLTVASVDPPDRLAPGASFTLDWTAENLGNRGAEEVEFEVRIAPGALVHSDGALLATGTTSLASLERKQLQTPLKLPDDLPTGLYRFAIFIDPDDRIAELEELDNRGDSELVLVASDQVEISTSSLPPAEFGAVYCTSLEAKGGDGEFAWSLPNGSEGLPAGLRFAEGKLCGRPAALGTFSFLVKVSSNGAAAVRQFGLEVQASQVPLMILSHILPPAIFSEPYTHQLEAAGGRAPFRWSLVGGKLPIGLSLSGIGEISGSAEDAGTFPFVAMVQDANGATSERSMLLDVGGITRLTCIQAKIPPALLGDRVNLRLRAIGGSLPFRWISTDTRRLVGPEGGAPESLGSNPPPGLSLREDGQIDGVPVEQGRYLWTVEVLDGAQSRASCELELDVSAERPLIVSTAGLASAVVGKLYRVSLGALGGVGDLRWRLAPGERLPPGLDLSSEGIIEGFPEGHGERSRDFPFLVEVTDEVGQRGAAALSLEVREDRGPAVEEERMREVSGGCGASRGGLEMSGLLAIMGGLWWAGSRRRGNLGGAGALGAEASGPRLETAVREGRGRGRAPLRTGTLILGAALALAACGNTETAGTKPKASWQFLEDPSGKADFLVEFGKLQIGGEAARIFEVENTGNEELIVLGGAVEAPFSYEIPEGGLRIPVGGKLKLDFWFRPKEAREAPYETIFELETNERKVYRVRLEGRGVEGALRCDPGQVDFGPVLKGTSAARTLRCTNEEAVPLSLGLDMIGGRSRRFFTASFKGEEAMRVAVPAGGEVEIEVRFQAGSTGKNAGVLPLKGPEELLYAEILLDAEVVDSSLILEPSSCFDFGYVPLGQAALQRLMVRNVGTERRTVRSISVEGPEADGFSVSAPTPLILEPGAEGKEIEVKFLPSEAGPRAVTIHLQTDDGNAPVLTSCASAYGGGPTLVCDPESLDFGPVAVGNPITRNISCINRGVAPEGEVVDHLFIERLETDNPAFQVTVHNPEDGSEGLVEEGYAIGSRFILQVSFSPEDEGNASGNLLIRPGGGELQTFSLIGDGRVLAPCSFSLLPPAMRFGLVDRGESRSLEIGIRNDGHDQCIVYDLDLDEESDASFTMEAREYVEIEPGETFSFLVSFAPQEHTTTATGTVRFQISNPDAREQAIALSGSSGRPCLEFGPEVIDFGKARTGCETRRHKVYVSNSCNRTIRVTTVETHESFGSESFLVASRPTLPATLGPFGSVEFEVAFFPTEARPYQGYFVLEVEGAGAGSNAPHLLEAVGEGSEHPIQIERFNQSDYAEIDILWVIDNSSSMQKFQERLRDNLPAFLEVALQRGLDFHLAVTTTGLWPVGGITTTDACPGGANCGEDGRFFPIDNSHPRILTPITPDLEEHWRFNSVVGEAHGEEFPFEAARKALTPPLIYEKKSSQHDSPFMDGNAGFLRDEAALAIIFVTDEEDHSTSRTPFEYLNIYRGLKRAALAWKVKVHSITGPKKKDMATLGCPHIESAERIMPVVEATGGYWMNLCTPVHDTETWTEGLRKMSESTFDYANAFGLRSSPGDRNEDGVVNEDDVIVRINGRVLSPKDETTGQYSWNLDRLQNAVVFTPLFVPPPRAKIEIEYEAACSTG